VQFQYSFHQEQLYQALAVVFVLGGE